MNLIVFMNIAVAHDLEANLREVKEK